MSETKMKERVVSIRTSETQPVIERELATAEVALRPSGLRGRRALIVVAAVAFLAGVAGSLCLPRSRTAASETKNALQDGGKATLGFANSGDADINNSPTERIEVICVETLPRCDRLRLPGTLSADEQSSVASNANGIVTEVRVDRGSIVKKGDVLVELDPTDAKNRLAEGVALVDELKAKLILGEASVPFVVEEQPEVKLTEATLKLAASRKDRAETLLPKNAISADECDLYRSEYECAVQRYRQSQQQVRQCYQNYQTAVVRLAALRKAVTDTTIVAPFDGVVAEKHVAVGEQVTGGFVASKVVTMVRTNPLRLSLTLPQHSVGRIELGGKVRFQVDCYPGKTFEAEVRHISPAVTSDTRSLLVEAITDNSDGALRPGLFAAAELDISEQQTEMLVPTTAVQRTGEVARVFVVRDGAAREQVVALGEAAKGKVEIRSGLTGKELLLSRPELLHDGDKVRQ
jgi:RND family efflux transporter MFP subunit